MKIVNGKWTLASLLVSSMVLGGCFGPFKKKSSGGGGGGGSSGEETDDEGGGTSTSKKTSGETPATTPTPTVPGAKDGYGCLQGIVTDGFTGQAIPLTDPTKIFVLIRGTKLTANKVDGLDGQYFICEIPVEETYPVFAYLDGYMPFESVVKITSTREMRVADDGQAVTAEVKIPDPIEDKALRIYPVGNAGKDLRVRAVYNGAGVKDAFIDLEAKSSDLSATYAFEGNFVNSAGTRIFPQRQKTNDDGYATFPASSLSLGAKYTLTVHAPAGSIYTAPTHADIVLGVSGASSSDLDTYDINIQMGNGQDTHPLQVVSCSTQFQEYNGTGSISFLFNREFKVVDPDNLDDAFTLAGSNNGTVIASDATTLTRLTKTDNNNTADNVTVSQSTRMLTLRPKFTGAKSIRDLDSNKDPTDPFNDDNRDAKVTWTFSKVKLTTDGDEDVGVQTLDTLLGSLPGGSSACDPIVRFFSRSM